MSEHFERPTRPGAFTVLSIKSCLHARLIALLTAIAAIFVLSGCDAQPTVSARRDAQVAMTILQSEADRHIAAYQATYQLAPRPDGDLQSVAETYMRRYQPGPEPRVFESSYIYDRKGRLLDEVFDEGRRVWVPLSHMSPSLIQALVATEDATFYTNQGVDTRRIVAAMLRNLANPTQLSGASTITMQLARNLFMPPEQRFAPTLDRKIDEVLLAQDLTTLFTKDEILEMYLNLAYFGHLAYGPEAAARTYFGKSALSLSMAEATMLAGLPQQPALLDPFINFEGAKTRQRTVLDLMVRRGYLSAAAADLVFAEPITLAADPDLRPVQAPHFLQYLRSYLAQRDELPVPGRAGLSIFTTLDMEMQALAQQVVSEQVKTLGPRFDLSNASLVALKPGTAELLVMVGSVDFYDERIGGQVNVALRQRQPGSALKPVIYAAAFDADIISPATVLWDLSVTYPITGSRPYTPRNYDNKLRGPVTARMALANSLNVPAIKVMEGLGLPRFVDTANRMGVRSLTDDDIKAAGLAMTLGGSEVTLFELATAYHTIANHGMYVEPTPILGISDVRGRPLMNVTPVSHRAISPAAAYLVTSILSDNEARQPTFGVNNPLKLSRPAVAKTGTTTSFRDNLTVGFTRYLVAGVWAGNNDGRPMRNATGVTGAAPIWNAFMEAVLANPALLRSLGAPEDPADWEFPPSEDVAQAAQPCPPELRCPATGEWFARTWLDNHALGGPFADAYQVGLFSRVQVERTNGQTIAAGLCLQTRTAFDDPDARIALALPRGFGDLAPRWRFVDTLADLEMPANAAEAAPLLAGMLDLSPRPFLPTPGSARPAVYAFAARTLQEQLAALKWTSARSSALSLGNCAEAEGVLRAMYGDDIRRIAISDPPRVLAAAVVTGTLTLSDSVASAGANASTEPGNYVLSAVHTDNNCPGNYVMGRVLNGDGAAIGGVAVEMVDQWGNRMISVSKGGGESGMFDFPIYSGSQRDLSLTVLDAGGSPASPTITLRYPPDDGASRCYHVVWRGAAG